MPNFRTHLRSLLDAPIEYRGEVGGAQGTRIGMRYRFFQWSDLKAYLRAEYFLERGPGIALETEYEPRNSDTRAYTQSYIARDSNIAKPRERTRWRYAGSYYGHPLGRCDTKAKVHYDVLSDPEMATDYLADDFNLHTARGTQGELIHQRRNVTTNLFTRVRVNTFQTISQELPRLASSVRPRTIGSTGIISAPRASAGYLNFVFARQSNTLGFNASRAYFNEHLYRPLRLGAVTLLPEFDATAIYYDNNPNDEAQMLASFQPSLEGHFRVSRLYSRVKHIVEPYVRYTYATNPTSTIPHHFIFEEEDAFTRLSYVRVGLRNLLYRKGQACGLLTRPLALDIFAYGFFNTPTIVGQVPRLFADLSWTPRADLTAKIESAWNLAHNQVDHFNGRLELTVSEDAALAVEFRYRSAFTYLKADPFNYVLDSFRPEAVLLGSALSDRRYTFLTDAFIRITPTVAIELQTRHGFKRRDAPPYNEGRITLHKILQCRWHLQLFYEHLEIDDRFAVKVMLGPGKCPRPVGHTPSVW